MERAALRISKPSDTGCNFFQCLFALQKKKRERRGKNCHLWRFTRHPEGTSTNVCRKDVLKTQEHGEGGIGMGICKRLKHLFKMLC